MFFCRNCGQRIEDGMLFCPNCGTPCVIDKKPEPEPQPAPEPEPEPIINEEPAPQPTRTYTKGTNGLAIAGFICAFLFPFVGLVLSIVASSISKADYEKPLTGLSTAGIIVSAILLLVRICLAVLIGAIVLPLIGQLIQQIAGYVSSLIAAA